MTNQTTPWYVIHAKPRRELLVATLLEHNDEVNVFLPEVLQHGRAGTQKAPLFPGYLFAQFDLAKSATTVISHTPGVLGLVGSERQPIPVPKEIVEKLQQQVESVNQQGGLPPHPFHQGDSVLITEGPLQGLEALFVGPLGAAQRVQVLLRFLGRQQEVTVAVGLLEKVNPLRKAQEDFPPSTHRPRRTRGHGRKVHLQN